MAEKIVMPKLAMSMKQGKVIEWMFAEGQPVEKGQVVLVIETEKVTYEVEAPVSGLLHIVVELNETIPIHGTLAFIAETEAELAELQAGSPGGAQAETAPEAPAPPEPAAPEPAPAAAPTPAAAPASVPEPATPSVTGVVKRDGKIKISPLARKIAGQHNLEISQIAGTGPGGRIKKRDVLAFMAQPKAVPAAAPAAGEPAWTGTVMDGKRVREIIPLTGMRQAMASHMSQSLVTSARVSVFMEIDMAEAIQLRTSLVKKQELLGTRISYTDLFIFLAARALKDQPLLNSTLGDDGIVVWEDVNVGVALSLAKGGMDTSLIVPVIKQADKKSLVEISKELKDLVRKGREGALTGDDMTGGTFTMTNTAQLLNRWHIQTPMITQPESTILGTSSTVEKPVVRDGEIVIRPMMPVSLSFDHRVMDGAQPTQFLSKFAGLIEDPDTIWAYLR
jgi:pyruvate dehydrogenase E2 component (dihydrolipoamide acetyltransferase)/2-oxoglutarate dehydrogenase E2 component (dihydrolipoamide succinyltransferase)